MLEKQTVKTKADLMFYRAEGEKYKDKKDFPEMTENDRAYAPARRRSGSRQQEEKQQKSWMSRVKNKIYKGLKRRGIGGNYVMGAVGAVIGMIGACIVAIALTAFLPRLYGVISTLIPVWASSAYIVMNGRREKSPIPVIIIFVVSLIGVILIGFGSDIMTPVTGLRMNFKRSVHQFKGNITDGKYWLTTLYHALVPLVFVLIGMAISVPKVLKKPVKRRRHTANV